MDTYNGQDRESLKTSFAHHMKYSLAKDRHTAGDRDRFVALALLLRDRVVGRWLETQQTYHAMDVKRVCYLSMEYLTGRLLATSILNLRLERQLDQALGDLGIDWRTLEDCEPDPALGNGGLGRLAACFMDSLATLGYPTVGYGLRYDYGIFRQEIRDGAQVEQPDEWLRYENPWEIARPDYAYAVNFGGRVEAAEEGDRPVFRWVDTQHVLGVPHDTPVVGYGARNINTLRLWSARAPEEFDLDDFNQGDYLAAVENKIRAENLTKVLYPNDNVSAGRELRFRQEYFFVSCTVQDILRRWKGDHRGFDGFEDKIAIQLNDTHPALAVPELMRVLIDVEGLTWERAWEIVTASTGYTNHTLLPEALERWPVAFFERILPRHIQIVYEINRRFLGDVAWRRPGDPGLLGRVSLIDEGSERAVRMANLAVVGSHAVNGVAALHTRLLKERVFKDLATLFPGRFTNKTNGITPRRWLMQANPGLSALITERIGDGWITDLGLLRGIESSANEAPFRARFREVKRANKVRLADEIALTTGVTLDPDSIFDMHVKRMHEYKRQLLNVLHILILYNRIKADPARDVTPRSFIFAGKAAPGYHMAKLVIRLIGAVADAVNPDPDVRGRIRVVFVPDYRVSLAERIVPAADVSEQISTAGMEASGTGNMKLALNGALTVGTLDGANIEIAEEVGEENIFIFGHKAEEIEAVRARGNYDPKAIAASDPEVAGAIAALTTGPIARLHGNLFEPIRAHLLDQGDRYFCVADLRPYADCQARVAALYVDQEAWSRKAVLNVARCGRFSSDRTIEDYVRDVWHLGRVDVSMQTSRSDTMVHARARPKA